MATTMPPTWRDRITADAAVLTGKPMIKGTRISVELVLDLLARGYRPEDVLSQYEQLTLEDLRACLAYATETLRSERVFAIPA